MSVISGIALSALRSLDKKMETTANNIANANTDGFKRDRVEFQETYPQGVKVTLSKPDEPGAVVVDDISGEFKETSNVSLEEEMVDLITTPLQYKLDLEVLKTEDEMLQSLIDIKA
ncbi:MAG: flagellar biosynthesis protein FlgC [Deltaproteobacteria bacterium]|nr:flagellar biosynthesis protein FlgC [Deltaproteobacteria bacterium]